MGINPSDFPFNFYLFICCPDDRYQCVHHLPLVLKADILPVIQIPGNAFHLLHRHSVRREFCNLIGNGLPPCVQFLNFAVGIGEQNRACARPSRFAASFGEIFAAFFRPVSVLKSFSFFTIAP